MKQMILDNIDLIEIMDSLIENENSTDILDILEVLKKSKNRVMLYSDDTIDLLYQKLHELRKYDDISLLSNLIERLVDYESKEEFNLINQKIEGLNKKEGKNINEILMQKKDFDFEFGFFRYNIKTEDDMRDVNMYAKIIDLLCIYTYSAEDPDTLISDLKKLFTNIIFDASIVSTIEDLNDGFDTRKSEIVYHLWCIEKEIPKITSDGVTHYQEIGDRMIITCSPERDRTTVKNFLTKNIDGKDLNCELHTKMKKLSSKAPDRIYFCPRIPEDFPEEFRNKIFIYKITKHVGT